MTTTDRPSDSDEMIAADARAAVRAAASKGGAEVRLPRGTSVSFGSLGWRVNGGAPIRDQAAVGESAAAAERSAARAKGGR